MIEAELIIMPDLNKKDLNRVIKILDKAMAQSAKRAGKQFERGLTSGINKAMARINASRISDIMGNGGFSGSEGSINIQSAGSGINPLDLATLMAANRTASLVRGREKFSTPSFKSPVSPDTVKVAIESTPDAEEARRIHEDIRRMQGLALKQQLAQSNKAAKEYNSPIEVAGRNVRSGYNKGNDIVENLSGVSIPGAAIMATTGGFFMAQAQRDQALQTIQEQIINDAMRREAISSAAASGMTPEQIDTFARGIYAQGGDYGDVRGIVESINDTLAAGESVSKKSVEGFQDLGDRTLPTILMTALNKGPEEREDFMREFGITGTDRDKFMAMISILEERVKKGETITLDNVLKEDPAETKRRDEFSKHALELSEIQTEAIKEGDLEIMEAMKDPAFKEAYKQGLQDQRKFEIDAITKFQENVETAKLAEQATIAVQGILTGMAGSVTQIVAYLAKLTGESASKITTEADGSVTVRSNGVTHSNVPPRHIPGTAGHKQSTNVMANNKANANGYKYHSAAR